VLPPHALPYLVAINLAGLVAMHLDKRRARRRKRRISENALFTIALMGGEAGIIGGMLAFRHKTRKASFMAAISAIVLVHVVLAIYFLGI